MARLTAVDQHILRHPPTPKTWVCGRKRVVERAQEDGSTLVIKTECVGINAGASGECSYCRKPKRAAAKHIWAQYLAACAKAGIEPGTRWPPKGGETS